MTVRDSTVRDCTSGALWAAAVQDLRFENVRLAGNEGWPLVSIEQSRRVVFDSCRIEGTTGDSLFWISGDSTGVSLPRTTIQANQTDTLLCEDSLEPDFSNTAFLENVFAGEEEGEDCEDCEGEDGDYGPGYDQGYEDGYDQGYEDGYADALGEETGGAGD